MGTAKRDRQREGRLARRIAEAEADKRQQRRRTIRNFVIVGILGIVGVVVLSRFVSGDENKANVATSDSSSASASDGPSSTSTPTTQAAFAYGTTPCPAVDGSSPRTLNFDAPFENCLDPTKRYAATFDTSAGQFTVTLDTDTTPGTANNFIALSRYHYYDGTQLFRTDTSIGIIQGGSPTSQSANDPGPGYSLPDEGFDYASLPNGQGGPYKYELGDIVMARSTAPNGAGAQFFLGGSDTIATLGSTGTYVRFGTTLDGVDVLQRILASNVDDPSSGLGGHPNPPVTVNSIRIAEA